MKTHVLVFVVLFFARIDSCFSQWQLANSGTANNIVDICFPSDSIGFAVTNNGIVLKTIDEGNNWNVIATLSGTFTSICNVGLDTIFVGGNKIYRSDNGGSSWNNLISLPSIISDLIFFDSQKGIYIKPDSYTCTSSQGTVTITDYQALSTSDSGYTWLSTFESLLPFSRLQLINDSTAYVNGASYYIHDHCNGTYYNFGKKTSDKGATWNISSIPGSSYSAFYFVNDTLEYLLAANTLWRVTSSISDQVRQMTIGVNQLVFVNEIDGYLLSGNTIYVTNTEGLLWYLDTIPISTTLNKLWNDHSKAMFAIGTNGTILKKEIIESLYPDSIYAMTANQMNLQFDTVIAGGSKTKQITVHNDGSVPLSISVSSTDTFQVSTSNNYSSNITFTLAAQRDSVINIRFTPADTLLYQDTLVISADSVSNIYVPLIGVGTANLIGQLSDFLYLCGDTINVVGNFTINNGGKLVICPGTVVYLRGPYIISVSGTLIADGLSTDSIWFTPENKTVGWGGISFNTTTNLDTSILRYCSINYKNTTFSNTIECESRKNVIIDHCSIYNSKGGIASSYSSIIISNNKIYNNNYGPSQGCAIKCFYDSSLIINNVIFNNSASEGAGIWILNHAPGYPKIIQNLIFNNTASGNGGGIYMYYSTPYLINNTICNNKGSSVGGIYYWVVDSNTSISNNIIYNNSGTQLYVYQPTHVNVGYCDIQGGYSGGIGIINQDPDFANPTDSIGVMSQIGNYDWSLNQNSPCINSGDTAFNSLIPLSDIVSNPRIFQSRIDIGAYEYQSLVSVNETENEFSVSLFPNPFTDALNIFVKGNFEPMEFILYDLLSRKMIQQQFVREGLINTKGIANGIYIYELRNEAGVIKKGKVVKD